MIILSDGENRLVRRAYVICEITQRIQRVLVDETYNRRKEIHHAQ